MTVYHGSCNVCPVFTNVLLRSLLDYICIIAESNQYGRLNKSSFRVHVSSMVRMNNKKVCRHCPLKEFREESYGLSVVLTMS